MHRFPPAAAAAPTAAAAAAVSPPESEPHLFQVAETMNGLSFGTKLTAEKTLLLRPGGGGCVCSEKLLFRVYCSTAYSEMLRKYCFLNVSGP